MLPTIQETPHAYVRVIAGERWCAKCGYSISPSETGLDKLGRDLRGHADHCPRCHSKRLVPADVLLPGEFELIQ